MNLLFQLALSDADRAIALKPDWPKCYYRRGRALKGLKRSEEAEISLKKVRDMEEGEVAEVEADLLQVRIE